MSEIEKLYENAGIGKQKYFVMQNESYKDVFEIKYPPFTAEKQLELIKWLADTDYYIHSIYRTIDTRKYCIENSYYDIETVGFEETIAGLINKLWRDLTEEEKQQIKEILE